MDLRIGLSLMVLAIATWPALGGPPEPNSRRIVVLDEEAPTSRKVVAVNDDETPKRRVIDLDSETPKAPPVDRLPDAEKPRTVDVAEAVLPVCPQPRVWIDGEALLWKVQKGPLRFPLVTTGNPSDGPVAGAVGMPGTRTLFGGGDLDYSRSP